MRVLILCTILAIVIVNASAGRRHYLYQAVRQAHAMHLIPSRSVVDKTAPGIQVAYYNVGPHQHANLHSALGGSIPYDVLRSLEHQVDSIGKYYY